MTELAGSTSPYLELHADSAVAWRMWDEQTVTVARESDRPIFLSIGYLANVDCRDRELDFYSIPAVVDALNEKFVCAKVDHDEHPEITARYLQTMVVHPADMGVTLGTPWPRYMVLEPQLLVAFFTSTRRYQASPIDAVQFTQELALVSNVFAKERNELRKLLDTIDGRLHAKPKTEERGWRSADHVLDFIREEFRKLEDEPPLAALAPLKFFQADLLDLLLWKWARDKHKRGTTDNVLDQVMNQLTYIARSGLYDHLGGGFFRSESVGGVVPTFEKHTAFNAGMLALFSAAVQISHDRLFVGVVRETAECLLSELSTHGRFKLASYEREAGFYSWPKYEVKRSLSDDEFLVFETLYGLDKRANFGTRWLPHRTDSWKSVVNRLFISEDECTKHLASAKRKLVARRARRDSLGEDDRAICEYNALAVRGLVRAAKALHEPRYVASAQACIDFLRTDHFDNDRLYRTKTSHGSVPANLADYAWLLCALLDLLECQWRTVDYRFAQSLAATICNGFVDEEVGFVYERQGESQPLSAIRPIDVGGETGSVLAAAGSGLIRYNYLHLGQPQSDTVKSALNLVSLPDQAVLRTWLDLLDGRTQVILRGPLSMCEQWQSQLTAGYRPWLSVYAIPYADDIQAPNYLPRLVSTTISERVTAFHTVATGSSAPIYDIDELRGLID